MLRRPSIRRVTALAAYVLLSAIALAQGAATRMLSGTVTDEHHKPVSGAVVLVQNEETKAVESFMTDRVGHFQFHRLAANTDYRVVARYHEHQSRPHEISKFNAKPNVVENLEVKSE